EVCIALVHHVKYSDTGTHCPIRTRVPSNAKARRKVGLVILNERSARAINASLRYCRVEIDNVKGRGHKSSLAISGAVPGEIGSEVCRERASRDPASRPLLSGIVRNDQIAHIVAFAGPRWRVFPAQARFQRKVTINLPVIVEVIRLAGGAELAVS